MSETAKHTPGPWRYEWDGSEAVIIGQPAWPCERNRVKGEWQIAVTDDLGDEPGTADEAEANARLIAAAPDLLEALRELDAALNDGLCNSGIPGFDGERLGRAQKAATIALAKTGATPMTSPYGALSDELEGRVTQAHCDILAVINGQPGGGVPVNELPLSMKWRDYRDCRDWDLLIEKVGRGNFVVAWITDAGRAALRSLQTGDAK